jgi:peptidoglycan/LPS O-acetylase OafA/YrhL
VATDTDSLSGTLPPRHGQGVVVSFPRKKSESFSQRTFAPADTPIRPRQHVPTSWASRAFRFASIDNNFYNIGSCSRGGGLKPNDNDGTWFFSAVPFLCRGVSPFFSAAPGGLGRLGLLYPERLLDLPDVASTVRSDASASFDIHDQSLVAPGADPFDLHGSELASCLFLGDPGALQRASNPVWWVRQLLIAGSNQVGTNLLPTWSLDVEMQFYLVAPFLITLFERVRPVFRWMIIAAASGWLIFFTFRDGNIQNAQLPLFVGFFLIGVTIEMCEWQPSRAMAMSSLIFFFGMTLILAICPQTRSGVWRAGLAPVLATNALPTFAVNLWWILGSVAVIPFVTWNVAQNSPRLDRLLGNLASPLYLFHWIPRDWYYHFSQRSDPIWKQCALLSINFLAASAGAVIILLVVDQPLDRLRARWVGARRAGVTGVAEWEGQT